MITVLVVDQVVRIRQGSNRARAVAVQAAIMMTQANRAAQVASRVLAGSGDRDAASEEFRTYTMMLLSVAPVLIEDATSRRFLERAQTLDGELARALSVLASAPGQGQFPITRIDDALQALRSASTPLLQNFDEQTLAAVRDGDEPGPLGDVTGR
jgi:hypothetical protein